jgi:hypothetical protein
MSKGVDRRTDVSRSVVLYLITTGERPFKGDSAGGTMLRILQGGFSPVHRGARLPRGTECHRDEGARAKPEDRFQTAEELQKELLAFLQTLVRR